MLHDSWSTTGTYKYSICFGIFYDKFFPFIAVMTAPILCSEIIYELLFNVLGLQAASMLLIKIAPQPFF